MGTQSVRHITCGLCSSMPQFETPKQSPTKPPRHMLQLVGRLRRSRQKAWHDLCWELYIILVVHKRDVCPQGSHFLLCMVTGKMIQIGGPITVLHNRRRLIQFQWLHGLSEQSVLGLHDLRTCLPVTFIHRKHCRKMFYKITL
jgi:hypothetical protein